VRWLGSAGDIASSYAMVHCGAFPFIPALPDPGYRDHGAELTVLPTALWVT
jgi:hypothetical protein